MTHCCLDGCRQGQHVLELLKYTSVRVSLFSAVCQRGGEKIKFCFIGVLVWWRILKLRPPSRKSHDRTTWFSCHPWDWAGAADIWKVLSFWILGDGLNKRDKGTLQKSLVGCAVRKSHLCRDRFHSLRIIHCIFNPNINWKVTEGSFLLSTPQTNHSRNSLEGSVFHCCLWTGPKRSLLPLKPAPHFTPKRRKAVLND